MRTSFLASAEVDGGVCSCSTSVLTHTLILTHAASLLSHNVLHVLALVHFVLQRMFNRFSVTNPLKAGTKVDVKSMYDVTAQREGQLMLIFIIIDLKC